MSRKNRLTLTQLLDKTNIKGDKIFQQFADSQKRKAESLIHALTVKGDESRSEARRIGKECRSRRTLSQ